MQNYLYCEICNQLKGGSAKVDHKKCAEILNLNSVRKRGRRKIETRYLNKNAVNVFIKAVEHE